ncbi:MAG: leucine-rich repeat domain-containing protein [Alistipes sp.]|nr:leucine-rich repeat domain-containing protein [Alistipes sp.]
MIPNSVTEIGPDAFSGCENLKSITIPENVTTLGTRAFSGCHNLKEVYGKPTTKEETPPHHTQPRTQQPRGY